MLSESVLRLEWIYWSGKIGLFAWIRGARILIEKARALAER